MRRGPGPQGGWRSEPPRPSVARPRHRAQPMAGDDQDDAARRAAEGALDTAVGAREVGRGLTEHAVGVDEVEGVHILCLRSARVERCRHQTGAQPLAARGEVVGRTGGELAQQTETLRQGLELLEHVADIRQHVRPPASRWQDGPRDSAWRERRPAIRDATVRDSPALARWATPSSASVVPAMAETTTTVGLVRVAADDVDGVADGGGVGQRRTAELVHMRRSAGPWHKSWRIPNMLTLLKLIQSIIKTRHSDGTPGRGRRDRARRGARPHTAGERHNFPVVRADRALNVSFGEGCWGGRCSCRWASSSIPCSTGSARACWRARSATLDLPCTTRRSCRTPTSTTPSCSAACELADPRGADLFAARYGVGRYRATIGERVRQSPTYRHGLMPYRAAVIPVQPVHERRRPAALTNPHSAAH